MTEQLQFHFQVLEKEMATHSSVLAWRIPGTGGAWWAAVFGVTQSRTRLKRLSSSSSSSGLVMSRFLSFSILIFSQYSRILCIYAQTYIHIASRMFTTGTQCASDDHISFCSTVNSW